jgi:hypothetical protein
MKGSTWLFTLACVPPFTAISLTAAKLLPTRRPCCQASDIH